MTAKSRALESFIVDFGAGPRPYMGAKSIDGRTAGALCRAGLLVPASYNVEVTKRNGGFGASYHSTLKRIQAYKLTEAGLDAVQAMIP